MIKVFLALLLLTIFILPKAYQTHSSLPENDLWMEDYRMESTQGAEMFNKVIDAAYVVYNPIAKNFGDSSLKINRKWEDSTVNANVSRWFGKVTINMYGGLFRRAETTVEGFTLVLCHELGHAYGGAPYIRAWQKLSAEGQADYAGTKDCFYKVMDVLKLEGYESDASEFITNSCLDKFENVNRQYLCERSLLGGESLGNLLATIKQEQAPNYETPDPTVVEKTLTSYPETVQCRLDTYLNGTLQLKRPACWFKD